MKGLFVVFALALAVPAQAANLSCVSTPASEARLGIGFLIDVVAPNDAALTSVSIRIRNEGQIEAYGDISRTVYANDELESRAGVYHHYRRFPISVDLDQVYLLLPADVTARVGKKITAFVPYKSPDDTRFKLARMSCSVN